MESNASNSPSDFSTEADETVDDADNSVLDQIMKMKQQRQKILHEFIRENEPEAEFTPVMKEVQENVKKKGSSQKVKRKSEAASNTPVRRSQRISCKIEEEQTKVVVESQRAFIERPENDYGPMPGINVGHHWETRMECSYDGVHRPTVAGIHAGPMGAYSIALSGGYPEDIDEGHTFTYTGAGGRDLKGTAMKPKNLRTAPQTKNQELEGVNYSLVRSIETGKPVRVIRGYKSDSIFAPETGYRYDGLYKVVKYWEDFGKTGFRIYRFRMVRVENQEPPPWEQPRNIFRRYIKSGMSENVDPNKDRETEDDVDGSFDDGISSPRSKVDYINASDDSYVIDSINGKGESELDSDIKTCSEKLCQSFVFFSSFCDNLKDYPVESSFFGWE